MAIQPQLLLPLYSHPALMQRHPSAGLFTPFLSCTEVGTD
ncbi:hypothetical protein RintRC_5633 [Richelia intracellularis]|nr:hypothetical protein RintRC_5633 [Richelia intracellularis]